MTPKEKAEKLVEKYGIWCWKDGVCDYNLAKILSLIAVDEIISLNIFDYYESDRRIRIEYWQEVKQEIEKL